MWKYSTESSDRAFEEEVMLSGFGEAPVKTEGAGVAYDQAQEVYTARYTHETIARLCSLKRPLRTTSMTLWRLATLKLWLVVWPPLSRCCRHPEQRFLHRLVETASLSVQQITRLLAVLIWLMSWQLQQTFPRLLWNRL